MFGDGDASDEGAVVFIVGDAEVCADLILFEQMRLAIGQVINLAPENVFEVL